MSTTRISREGTMSVLQRLGPGEEGPRMIRHYTLRHAALPLLALVAALTVSSHSSWGQAKQAAVPGTLEGTWTVTVTPGPGGPPPYQALATFTSNGGLIVTGASSP